MIIGKPNGKQVQPVSFPAVTVYIDLATATDDNPNGIQVRVPGNMIDLAVIQLLAEGMFRWTTHLRMKGDKKLSTMTLADGSRVPLPDEVPQGG